MLVFTVDRTSCHLWVQFTSDGWMVGFLRKVVEAEAEEEPEAPAATVVVVEGGKVDKGGYRTKNPRILDFQNPLQSHGPHCRSSVDAEKRLSKGCNQTSSSMLCWGW